MLAYKLAGHDSRTPYAHALPHPARYAMPPTFSGKYDREYFDKFVGQTQYIVGFCCFAGSFVFLVMALAAVFLRAELQALQQAEHDLEEALAQDEATMDHLLRRKLKIARIAFQLRHHHNGSCIMEVAWSHAHR